MPFLFAKVRAHNHASTHHLRRHLLQYGAAIRTRCKFAAEAAQVAAMIKENALKQRTLEQSSVDEKSRHSGDGEPVNGEV
jgi:hypothetical protein